MRITVNKEVDSTSSKRLFKDDRTRKFFFGGLGIILLIGVFFGGAFAYRNGFIRSWLDNFTAIVSGNGQLSGPLKEIKTNLDSELRLYQNNGLPTLTLDIPFKSLQQLTQKRDEAVAIGVLMTTDADYVTASVRYQDGPELKVKMRLKGDWTDHLKGEKWSYRINLDENGYINGMRQFSIQAPETRQFLKEWGYHQFVQGEGLLTTKYSFVNIVINGKAKGIYAIEEGFSKELIETQGRRSGLLLEFDEEIRWHNIASFWNERIINEGNFMVTNFASADVTTFSSKKLVEDPLLSTEANTALSMLRGYQEGKRTAADTFDTKLWGRFFAINDLWSATHGIYWGNIRFYFNPITGLIEPVAYDAEPLTTQNINSIVSEFIAGNRPIFNDPEIRVAYAEELERLTQENYLRDYFQRINPDLLRFQAALGTEYTDQTLLELPWELLEKRSKSLQLELKPAQAIKGVFQVQTPAGSDLTKAQFQIDLVNLMLFPVELIRFEISDTRLDPNLQWVPEGYRSRLLKNDRLITMQPVLMPEKEAFLPVRFNIPYDITGIDFTNKKKPFVLYAIVRIQGLEEEFSIPVISGNYPESLDTGPNIQYPGLDAFLKENIYLYLAEDKGTIYTKPGEWKVEKDLILPRGINLVVQPGTTLRFAEKTALISLEGAISLLGSEQAPILLTAEDPLKPWQGVLIMRAKGISSWKYATLERTVALSRLGWMPTASFSFSESPVDIDHCRFLHTNSEDVINIIHTEFQMANSEVGYSFSDAIDTDFAKGKFVHISLHDIGADGMDLGSSDVTIDGLTVLNSQDKGISAGENSQVIGDNITLAYNLIGVAAKDGSKVQLTGVSITSPKVAALAAYIKKAIFQPPSKLEMMSLTVENAPQLSMIQTNSIGIVDGTPLETQDMDVAALYAEGVLGYEPGTTSP